MCAETSRRAKGRFPATFFVHATSFYEYPQLKQYQTPIQPLSYLLNSNLLISGGGSAASQQAAVCKCSGPTTHTFPALASGAFGFCVPPTPTEGDWNGGALAIGSASYRTSNMAYFCSDHTANCW